MPSTHKQVKILFILLHDLVCIFRTKRRLVRLYREKPSVLTDNFYIDNFRKYLETGGKRRLLRNQLIVFIQYLCNIYCYNSEPLQLGHAVTTISLPSIASDFTGSYLANFERNMIIARKEYVSTRTPNKRTFYIPSVEPSES